MISGTDIGFRRPAIGAIPTGEPSRGHNVIQVWTRPKGTA